MAILKLISIGYYALLAREPLEKLNWLRIRSKKNSYILWIIYSQAIKIANKKKLKTKLLSRKTNAFTLLEREIAIMKKISHPNVVQLYEVIDDSDHQKLYLVMEYVGKGAILSKGFFSKSKGSILDEISESSSFNRNFLT